jgi:hypothetical protein
MEDILGEMETPAEREAARDLERLGEAKTRERAAERLEKAYQAARERETPGQPLKPDDPKALALEEAIRYYARAHGLPTNIKELFEDIQVIDGVMKAAFEDPKLREKGQFSDHIQKRWGTGAYWMRLSVEWMMKLRLGNEAPPAAAPTRQTTQARPDGGGMSKGTKIAIGAGAGAAALIAVAAGGGGSSAPPASAPTPAPTPSAFNPAGVYDVTLAVVSDPAGNAARIGMESSLWLNVTVAGSTMQYTCPPGSHINPGGGPVDVITGAFNAAGAGPFAGRNAVQFQFPGTFSRDGALSGEYRVGTGGELGGITTYSVSGRIRR